MLDNFKFINRIAPVFLMLLLFAPPVFANEPDDADAPEPVILDQSPAQPSKDGDAEEYYPEETPLSESKVETHTLVRAYAGYRILSTDAYPGRAAEYDYLHSNPVGGGMFNSLGRDHKISLEGSFLNDKDYHGEFFYDYKGAYRLHARTESLFHNLDHEQLFAPNNVSNVFFGSAYNASDLNPGDRYGVKVEQDLAEFRYKLSDYPVHFNMGYWRIAKDGTSQLRFADQAFHPNGATNTIFSKTRPIDRQTHEGTFGFDGHLGPVDIIYGFTIRELEELSPMPRDQFNSGVDPAVYGALSRIPGLQQHDENPESRFYSHTIKLHTSLTGGIVGAASYTFGKRENRSTLTDIQGADRTRDTLHNVAGDFVYTPCKEFSMGLKFRRQDIDRGTPGTITSLFSASPEAAVRPAIDTQKNVVAATLSIRPTNLLTFKGEYRGEFVHRDNLQYWNQPDKAVAEDLPENSATHKGTFAILSRPLKGLRLKAQYSYSATDHPSYANSSSEKHDGQILATYALLNMWGMSASYRITSENNDKNAMETLPYYAAPVTYRLPRDRKSVNSTFTVWVTPVERLTLTGSYGLLRDRTDQGVIFMGTTPGSQDPTNFTSQAQVYSVSALYHLNEMLDLSAVLQQVRSYAEFDPAAKAVDANNNTSGIKEISQTKTLESSVSTRAEYHVTKNLTCTFDYTFRDYDDRNAVLFNGTVQTVMAYLTTKW